jgi:hypothetical protein
MDRWAAIQQRWETLTRWRGEVIDEFARLPETLRQFREGVANFQVVSERLAGGTEALEQLNDLYSAGVSDRVRQLTQAVEDFNRTVASVLDLNPFLRSRRG